MKKKVLIVGNGANAYALAKELSEKHDIYVTPSSDTLKEFATTLDIRENNVNELLEFALENQIDITIPFSQAAIEADIATIFSRNNQAVFAPSAQASEISFNKAYAKKMLYRLRISTPKFGIFEKETPAIDYINNQKVPFVLKNNDSSSAAIITSQLIAKNLINATFIEKNKKLIVEDYVYGTPFTFYSITDGYKALPFGSSLNYKHALDGDGGQLTSGMASCVPNYKLSNDDEYFLMDNVIYPALESMERNGFPYIGILGVNGIKIEDGNIYVLGWNSMLEDADAAGILKHINSDLYSLIESCVIGSFSDEQENILQKDGYAVSLTIVNTSKESEQNVISEVAEFDDDTIVSYYPNVKLNKYLEHEATCGPVCVVTTFGATISSAIARVYEEAKCIDFKGIHYRKDICKIKNPLNIS